MANEMPTRYDASSVESKWYARWEEAGLFQPDSDPAKPPYTITIPPPNITGSLHMGHALCYPLQDWAGRYQRLRGKSVLILPGQDHAGIATQSVVEKLLRKEGTSGAQIGREKFLERTWQWRQESGDTILRQFRALGCGFDWSRSRFTLDEGYAKAVLQVFIEWFERGLIFRGKRVVNWDPVLRTSVSDIETERKLVKGHLYYIRYPFADGDGSLVIATTRPETMLADVAVAVHPSDERYQGKIGRELILPLTGRKIPLIADLYPDPKFGSGAVKITPAHDPNDYQVGVRHSLDMPVVLDEQARVDLEGSPYHGLDRYEARKRIVADLEEQGFLVEIKDHEIAVVVSERSGEVIEPLLSEQWFADQAKLAPPVIQAVEEGRVRFYPERYNGIFLDWMRNIREWCLSRQLWWGHRIPVYYDEAGKAYAALSWEDAQAKAGDAKIVRQDEDVLDTWFSSGLWPFATLGWPEETPDLKRFYPTQALITDRNIINLWVARMLMMGIDFMGKEPFSEVAIYATVLNEKGQRMSKSLGTGVDPMGIIEAKGADALRYTLLSQTGENQDIRYSDRKTDDARNLCNKLFNATRFVLMNVEGEVAEPEVLEDTDRWLLSRLFRTEAAVREAYDRYHLQDACQALYRFFWSEMCDWYIEVSKSRLADPERRAVPQWVLVTALDALLKMLHPVMPHITEELYSYLPIPGKAKFLMAASWPELPESYLQPESEARIERVFEIVRALRALRAGVGLAAMKTAPVAFVVGDLGENSEIVRTQAWFDRLELSAPPAGETCVSATAEGVDLFVPIGDLDLDRERERLIKEEEKLRAELAKVAGQLDNPQFREKAKPEFVERLLANRAELEDRLAKLADRRKAFGV
jgi:valyl-tRNA synthetase